MFTEQTSAEELAPLLNDHQTLMCVATHTNSIMVISRAEDFCDTGESVSKMRVIMVMRVMMYVSQSLSAILYTCEVLARVHKSFQKSPSLNLITSSLSFSLSVSVCLW